MIRSFGGAELTNGSMTPVVGLNGRNVKILRRAVGQVQALDAVMGTA